MELGKKDIHLGRMGEGEEVANHVIFLAGSEGDYISGAEIVIDGGNSSSSIHGMSRWISFEPRESSVCYHLGLEPYVEVIYATFGLTRTVF